YGTQGRGRAGRPRRPIRRDQGTIPGLLRARRRKPRRGDRRCARPGGSQSRHGLLRDPAGRHLLSRSSQNVTHDDDDDHWIGLALSGARPRAVAALYRYFRDLDLAEEAFQDACLRALTSWRKNGPPRDPAAWLILVGRNAGIDGTRRRVRFTPLPDEDK